MKRFVQLFIIFHSISKIKIKFIFLFFCIIKKEKPKVMLPSSIFESEIEEKVGLLNKAAPQSGNIQ